MKVINLRNMNLKFFVPVLLSVTLNGCASLNSVSVTPIPPQRGNTVTAQASRFIFLGFNFDNDYVDAVTKDLSSRCPGGKISGILTKDETINYFLFFFYKKQITATGYCEKSVAQR